MAVLVPRRWRLGDPLTGAWSVDGVEGSVTVTPWAVPSLPEDVAPVVRAWVGGL
jgi:hypothetical protein